MQELLRACTAADQQGATLLAARDRATQGVVAALQEFIAALTLLLPPNYATQSHHAKWARALQSLLRNPTVEVRHFDFCQHEPCRTWAICR
jgi:hypothetical protein